MAEPVSNLVMNQGDDSMMPGVQEDVEAERLNESGLPAGFPGVSWP